MRLPQPLWRLTDHIVNQGEFNEPVPVQKMTSSLDLYPLETIDLDSLDLFLSYCHGPDETKEIEQSVKPLFISDFGNLQPISEYIEREPSSTSFYSYFPGNFGHVILPLEMGSDCPFYSLKNSDNSD